MTEDCSKTGRAVEEPPVLKLLLTKSNLNINLCFFPDALCLLLGIKSIQGESPTGFSS